MDIQNLEDGSRWYADDMGMLHSYTLGKGVVVHVCKGVSSEALAKPILEDGERQLREFGRCVFMVDASESRRMTTEFRDKVTGWLGAHKERVVAHLLIRSKLMEMAINVANLVIGGATARAYSSADEWKRAGIAELPTFRTRPAAWLTKVDR